MQLREFDKYHKRVFVTAPFKEKKIKRLKQLCTCTGSIFSKSNLKIPPVHFNTRSNKKQETYKCTAFFLNSSFRVDQAFKIFLIVGRQAEKLRLEVFQRFQD